MRMSRGRDKGVATRARPCERNLHDLMLADVCSHVTEHVFLDYRCLLLAATLQFGSSATRSGSIYFCLFVCLCCAFKSFMSHVRLQL